MVFIIFLHQTIFYDYDPPFHHILLLAACDPLLSCFITLTFMSTVTVVSVFFLILAGSGVGKRRNLIESNMIPAWHDENDGTSHHMT